MIPKSLNALVAESILINSDTLILRVVPDGWALPGFTPGQFATLGLKGDAPRIPLSDPEAIPPPPEEFIVRAYSVASSSRHREYLEVYVSLVRSGALTPRLFALQRGDRLFLGPKISGLFTLDEVPAGKNLVMIATGTGVAPYVSMLRTFASAADPRRIAVIHGARHSWDLGYRSELSTLDSLLERIDYIPVISRPADEITPWGGAVGYVQDVWQGDLLAERWGGRPTAEETHILLCGNPGMINAMNGLLLREGFREHTRREAGQVHLEKYW